MAANTGNKSNAAKVNRFEQFSGGDAAAAFSKLQSAVNNLGTNVLIADKELNLIYMNERSEATLRAVEDVLEKELGLTVDELLGGSLDRFHGGRAAVTVGWTF